MIETIIHIKSGQVTNKVPVYKFFKELPDGSYSVRFTPRKIRSLGQNAYYHAIMVPMVRDGLLYAGYDMVKTNDDAHEVLKTLFHKKEIVNKQTGDLIAVIPGTTTDMSTIQFSAYMETIAKWAAEYLGIFIPPPGMQLKIHE